MPLGDLSDFRFYTVLKDRVWKRAYHRGLTSAGFVCQLRGFKAGVEVHGIPDLGDPQFDSFSIFATGGSQREHEAVFVAKITETEDGVSILIRQPDGDEIVFEHSFSF